MCGLTDFVEMGWTVNSKTWYELLSTSHWLVRSHAWSQDVIAARSGLGLNTHCVPHAFLTNGVNGIGSPSTGIRKFKVEAIVLNVVNYC